MSEEFRDNIADGQNSEMTGEQNTETTGEQKSETDAPETSPRQETSPKSEELSKKDDAESEIPSSETGTSKPAEFDEHSDAADREEGRLDALDSLPESRRRTAIIVAIIIVLSIVCIVVVVLNPPLSWHPEKKKTSSFHPVADIVSVEASEGVPADMYYAQIESEQRYRLELRQISKYAQKADVRTELTSDIVLDRPALRQADDEITIQLADVDTHVFDGDKEVKLASAGAMLEGISLYSRLERYHGMSSVVPDANINPQVARVLFIVADTLRYVWTPVPEQKCAVKSTWNFNDKAEDGVDYVRSGRSVLESENGKLVLSTSYELKKQSDGSSLGTGTSRASFSSGWLEQAHGTLNRKVQNGEGAAMQEIHFQLVRSDSTDPDKK